MHEAVKHRAEAHEAHETSAAVRCNSMPRNQSFVAAGAIFSGCIRTSGTNSSVGIGDDSSEYKLSYFLSCVLCANLQQTHCSPNSVSENKMSRWHFSLLTLSMLASSVTFSSADPLVTTALLPRDLSPFYNSKTIGFMDDGVPATCPGSYTATVHGSAMACNSGGNVIPSPHSCVVNEAPSPDATAFVW